MIIHNRGAMLAGLGVGAGLMYFLDPGRGARRRAAVRDRVTHAVNVAGDAAGATGRDLAHRASGAAARLRGTFAQEPVDDRVLVDRVRARLGRVVSHPHAIDVEASDGVVTLRGPILQAEVPQLLGTVERISGVREVVNNLEVHEQAGNIPALQGGTTPPGLRSAILPREWSPTARLVAGSLGFALTGYGASRRTVPGALLAATGIGLVARAVTNLDTQRLTGLAGRRAIEVQEAITIDAPHDAATSDSMRSTL
jgi:osmotically-inducible protein OsmY